MYTCVHWCAQGCAGLREYILVCPSVRGFVWVHISVPKCAWVGEGICGCATHMGVSGYVWVGAGLCGTNSQNTH